MTNEQFEAEITSIFIKGGGYDIVIFARSKYDFEEDYVTFEIILHEDLNGDIEIDKDYHEGEDSYIIDGWCYLFDLLHNTHAKGEYIK